MPKTLTGVCKTKNKAISRYFRSYRFSFFGGKILILIFGEDIADFRFDHQTLLSLFTILKKVKWQQCHKPFLKYKDLDSEIASFIKKQRET
jgi:hypothetical protein